jgi:hypothetical protein
MRMATVGKAIEFARKGSSYLGEFGKADVSQPAEASRIHGKVAVTL